MVQQRSAAAFCADGRGQDILRLGAQRSPLDFLPGARPVGVPTIAASLERGEGCGEAVGKIKLRVTLWAA